MALPDGDRRLAGGGVDFGLSPDFFRGEVSFEGWNGACFLFGAAQAPVGVERERAISLSVFGLVIRERPTPR